MVGDVLEALTAGGKVDGLIIVPPFGGIDRPSLGVHLLQAIAREAGHNIRILYANLLLAAQIGIERYTAICYAPTADLIGERFFTLAAFGHKPRGAPAFGERQTYRRVAHQDLGFSYNEFLTLQQKASDWCDEIAFHVTRYDFRVVGATTTFEQTSASIALLERIKRLSPATIAIIGGANCEGEMSKGILSLWPAIDHVFAGESEATFGNFLEQTQREGFLPRIIEGKPNDDLDALPPPNFDDYYMQFRSVLSPGQSAKIKDIWLPYETSRGCWWGQKHHCTFCGINGQGMAFRSKHPDRVISDLKSLTSKHPTNKVLMVDNIMPHSYFKDLLPRLADDLPGLHIFYEQKANLTLEKVEALKRGGVQIIQPGIEALSTPLLKHMKKGVSSSQNISLLRYARSVGLTVTWNLLYAFPHDEIEWYEQTVRILPFLRHLSPPTGLYQLSIDRFSPYYDQASMFGLQNLRPGKIYESVFPDRANLNQIAYHFVAEYPSGSLAKPSVIEQLSAEIARWVDAWKADEAPKLLISKLARDEYILFDSRSVEGNGVIEFLDEGQAVVALVGTTRTTDTDDIQWGLDRNVCANIDGLIVPLAVACPELLHELESH